MGQAAAARQQGLPARTHSFDGTTHSLAARLDLPGELFNLIG